MSFESNKRKRYCESRRDVRQTYVNRMEIYTDANTLKDSIRFSEIMQNIKAVTVQQAQYYTIDNIPHLV